MTQMVKNMPARWETQDPSLSWEDTWRRKWLATTRILTWRISWTEEPGGLFISFMNV